MATFILKTGSKGKPVLMLQRFLNLKGKLPKPIPENGEFDSETKAAVLYFQKMLGLKTDAPGTVGPETAAALAKLVGSAASAFAKAFGKPQVAAEGSANKKEAEKKSTTKLGKAGKHGNTVLASGAYLISIPPNPAGMFPLLVLFAGNTKKAMMIAGTPESTFKNAIVVFGERNGSFSGFQSALNNFLKENQASIGSVSICGYSSGGQAAFANYGHATKAVGLIDPNIQAKDFGKFDGKTILSINGSTADAWPWPADPQRKGYTIGQARLDSVDLVKKAGGYAETTSQGHGAYPAYFLKKFEGKLI
jgi:peptidoglycan hydrolase-like protein with peptidoglycan-binding domain